MSVLKEEVQNHVVTVDDTDGDNRVSATAFAQGYNSKTGEYNAAGGILAYENTSGTTASLTAQHVPTFGKQLEAAGQLNLIQTRDHSLDVKASSTLNVPKNFDNFTTQTVEAKYSYLDRMGAQASVSRTPVFKQTDYSVGGNLNLHKTATSSLDVGVSAARTNIPSNTGKWEPKGTITFTKYFK